MAECVNLPIILPFAARPAASQAAVDQEAFEYVVEFVNTLMCLRSGYRLGVARDLVATACMLADVAASIEGEPARVLVAQRMLAVAKRLDPYVLGAPERQQ